MEDYEGFEEGEEENIYDDDTREDLLDGDELSPEEEGFMYGYEEASKKKGKKKKELTGEIEGSEEKEEK